MLKILPDIPPLPLNEYPDSDGRPMGETPRHIRNLRYLAEALEVWFADDPLAYVAANMFVYYVEGDRNRHVSPDLFVTQKIPKTPTPERRRYLVWEEGKGPDFVLELTSESTREEDVDDKMAIYRDRLRVREYFLFDPYAEFLEPRLQGYRLVGKRYRRIVAIDGRLPSEVLGLHLEAVGELVRLYNPATGQWLPIPPEERQARQEADVRAQEAQKQAQEAQKQAQQAEKKSRRVEKKAQQVAAKVQEVEAENERLRRELEELKRKLSSEEQPPSRP